MSIITKTELKSFLDITDTSLDTYLDSLATRVCGVIEAYLNRIVEAANYTETHDGGDEMIIVRHTPLNSVAALSDYGSALTSDDYTFYESGIVQLYAGKFSNIPNGVSITYNGGYTTVPAAITEAAIELGALIYDESKAGEGRIGKGSISIPQGGGTLSYIRSLNPMLLAALDRYKMIEV